MRASALGTRRWIKIRKAVLVRDGYRCQYCGAHADSVDHVVPRAEGGGDEPSNLRACCRKCNSRKGNGFLSGQETVDAPRRPISPQLPLLSGDYTRKHGR